MSAHFVSYMTEFSCESYKGNKFGTKNSFPKGIEILHSEVPLSENASISYLRKIYGLKIAVIRPLKRVRKLPKPWQPQSNNK